jgi:hypothetical protein
MAYRDSVMSQLPLPISPCDFATRILPPALALLPEKMDSRQARALVLAICLQESGLAHRTQMNGGPARGLAQFERGGGVRGVLTHPASRDYADRVCRLRGIQPTPGQVYNSLADDDILAVALARLLLWTDPHTLPADEQGGWDLYARVWRPGKPRPDDWPANYRTACETVM